MSPSWHTSPVSSQSQAGPRGTVLSLTSLLLAPKVCGIVGMAVAATEGVACTEKPREGTPGTMMAERENIPVRPLPWRGHSLTRPRRREIELMISRAGRATTVGQDLAAGKGHVQDGLAGRSYHGSTIGGRKIRPVGRVTIVTDAECDTRLARWRAATAGCAHSTRFCVSALLPTCVALPAALRVALALPTSRAQKPCTYTRKFSGMFPADLMHTQTAH